jgi:fructose-bisphosphate aldolase class I
MSKSYSSINDLESGTMDMTTTGRTNKALVATGVVAAVCGACLLVNSMVSDDKSAEYDAMFVNGGMSARPSMGSYAINDDLSFDALEPVPSTWTPAGIAGIFAAVAGSVAVGYTAAKKGIFEADKVEVQPINEEVSQPSQPTMSKAKMAFLSVAGQQPRPYDLSPGGPEELIANAAKIASKGKGILASDESNGTCGLRLEQIGVENSEENRRTYRELLFTTPGLGESCSGAILFEETLYQDCKDGTSFVDKLTEQGVMVGIKVDKGLKPIPGTRGEVSCTGLDDLPDRAARFYERGARFAKWRAVLNITKDGNPTELCIQDTAYNLARYASICQSAGLVPIVEPEILMDGDHTIEEAQAVHERVWAAVYKALHDCGVLMEGSLLKPSMVVPGVNGPKVSSEEIAKRTVDSLMRRVPPAVAGITFLSGGQSEEGATWQLNDMNVYAAGKNPWSLTFSYGRALQASVLKVWQGKAENVAPAQKMLYDLLTCNGKAQQGIYDKSSTHPSTTGSLYVDDYKY